ncbi:FAD/NAD(P)-binding protein [Kocuria rhizophila]|uniref:FAD/NAD(P)-binding protein n=1 Tax=Kocuria rhizophila TaxID=72000 RepID=UPI001DE11AA2|nr:FAD/NAD(P)-binding protein [Kocuria rhizophila]MCC5673591.1 FAD/NAD(P)-binding protein [Kocuria rhizophila]
MVIQQRVVVVGAGPRGLSVVERLVARSAHTGARVHIDLVDPFPPGPGHVWRTDQSDVFLMNTPSLFPTVLAAPDALQVPAVAPLRGMSFERWRRGVVAGEITPVTALTQQQLHALAELTPQGYPPRAVYGRYLEWVFATLRENLPDTVHLEIHRGEAVDAWVRADGRHRYGVELAGGLVLPADAVVLALGHLDAHLRPSQKDLVDGAAEYGLTYWPPTVPADASWSELPSGETVLVRGMGLNFCDALARLTEGRGGTFEEDPENPERLVYRPSGREPKIVAGSRRGTPYRAKPVLRGYYAESLETRFFTLEAVQELAAASPGTLSFERQLWPLIRKDVIWNYYSVLVRTTPEAFQDDPSRFLRRLDAILRDTAEPNWAHRSDALISDSVVPGRQLQQARLARPFEDVSFASHDEYAAAVVHYLDRDVRGSLRGEDDPVKMAIASLNAARTVLKCVLAEIGISDSSWVHELRRQFEPLVEGLASGPPVLRIQQLAALTRAGVVRFLGPEPRFVVDRSEGCFVAASPWVEDAPVRSRWLIEAMSPANDVHRNISPLLSHMHERGLVRAKLMETHDGASPETSTGLDVSAQRARGARDDDAASRAFVYRAVGAKDHAEQGIYVIGLQLSSVQWGVAIAAEAESPAHLGARTIADADQIAQDVLAGAQP